MERDAEKREFFPVMFDFNAAEQNIDVPEEERVYLMSSLSNPPWQPSENFLMNKAGEKFVLSTDVPAGILEYKFAIVSPDGKIKKWIPEGGNLTREIKGDENGGVDVPSDTSDATFMRRRVGREVLNLLQEEENGEAGPKLALKIHKRLREFVDLLKKAAELPNERVRKFLEGDIQAEIDARVRDWIAHRGDLKEPVRDLLSAPKGRLEFLATVFNHLCEQNKLGLHAKNKISGSKITEESAISHMRGKLGAHWDAFYGRVSHFTGSNISVAMKSIASEVAKKGASPDRSKRASARAYERLKLGLGIQKRVSAAEQSASAPVEVGTFWKSLAEGGDLYLKTTALFMLFSNPALAAAIWSARGLIQGLRGADFAGVMREITKVPLRVLERGGKMLKYLPEKLKDKLPAGMQKWLEEPSSSIWNKVGRASLSWDERKKLFLRGLVPAPWLMEHIPRIKEYVPQAERSPGEAMIEQRAQADEDINAACDFAFANLTKPKADARRAAA